MGLIRLQNVSKQFGERMVLDDVSLELHTGQTVGLVGANGSGKTTIFRIIAGEIAPDTGTVTLSKGLEVGYLPQEPRIAQNQTLHDEVLSVFADVLALERKLHALSEQMAASSAGPPSPANPSPADQSLKRKRGTTSDLDNLMIQYDRVSARFEAAGGYRFEQRLGEILGGLGFQPDDYKLSMAALSGGQKCRAALAKLLLEQSQFLLLDEPTNHLDIDAVRWLEKFLAGHHGGAVVVSHDRYLLDRLADRIVEVEGGRVHSYPGNYTDYIRTKELRAITQERRHEQDQAFIQKERAFISKHMGKQRTAEAKGRLKRLERRLKAGDFVRESPKDRQHVRIAFDRDAHRLRSGKDVLAIDGLCKQYGDKVLFTDLSLRVPVGQRLGITGPNGTGKTTLLKIILGQVPADRGEWRFSARTTIGYYAQEATDLEPEHTIVQEIQAVRGDMLESQARSLAARFLFRDEEPFKRIDQLSGGEQSRVRLMKIILTSPNVLVLDEPTNHLDIPSREMLEEALSDFPGTIIAVSHDRYFLDRICQCLLVLRQNRHALYDGNYSYYIEQTESLRAAEQAAAAEAESRRRRASSRRARGMQPRRPRSRLARLKLEELERLIMRNESRLAELSEQFGDARIYQDAAAVTRLRGEFDTLKAEVEEAQAEWDARAERESGR